MKSKICDGPFVALFSSHLRNILPMFHDRSHSADLNGIDLGEFIRSSNGVLPYQIGFGQIRFV